MHGIPPNLGDQGGLPDEDTVWPTALTGGWLRKIKK